MFKVAYTETEQTDSAYRMETTKIPSAFQCILKYLGLWLSVLEKMIVVVFSCL